MNSDQPHRWAEDIDLSVDQFNRWFMTFAPEAIRSERAAATENVQLAFEATEDLRNVDPKTLRANPGVLPMLRLCTAPPLAVDRLVGLSGADKNLVTCLEGGACPTRMAAEKLESQLQSICDILTTMLDRELFPWLESARSPTRPEREKASTIVADRRCNAVANPIVRNAHEKRQHAVLDGWLQARGYSKRPLDRERPIAEMEPGTYAFRTNLLVGKAHRVDMPIDAVVQPRKPRVDRLPVLIEAKSAGDFTNTNKRRKEEAFKIHQLQEAFGVSVTFVLLLCGYFGRGYLEYVRAVGIDWAWEHRIDDLAVLGL
jgi:hypothetical protein